LSLITEGTVDRDIFTYFLVFLIRSSSVRTWSSLCSVGSRYETLPDMKASPSVVGSESMLLTVKRFSFSVYLLLDVLNFLLLELII